MKSTLAGIELMLAEELLRWVRHDFGVVEDGWPMVTEFEVRAAALRSPCEVLFPLFLSRFGYSLAKHFRGLRITIGLSASGRLGT